MKSISVKLQKKLATIPARPGCYLFKNQAQAVIYVGKSRNLKQRVKQYFVKTTNQRLYYLVQQIEDVEIILTNNEKEALILEFNLIKQYLPFFNIILKDDKRYPYIIITQERHPRWQYVRKLPKKYSFAYGPLPTGSKAWQIFDILQFIIPLRRCRLKEIKAGPCFYYHLQQCSQCCVHEVQATYYQTQIKKAKQILQAENKVVAALLTERMQQLAANLQFEAADKVKKLLEGWRMLIQNQIITLNKNKQAVDVIAFIKEDHVIYFTSLFFRYGRLLMQNSDHFQITVQNNPQALMMLYLQNVYQTNALPAKIIIADQLDSATISRLLALPVMNAPKTGVYRKALEIAEMNCQQYQKQTQKTTSSSHSTQQLSYSLQSLLALASPPVQIDVLDISNWGTGVIMGGCAVYYKTEANRLAWRRYILQQTKPDDPLSIALLVKRRYGKLSPTIKYPDLLIVDGGMLQLQAAKKTLKALELSYIPVVGLIKDAHHKTKALITAKGEVMNLVKHKQLFLWLTKVQEAVHNYAIKGFRYNQRLNMSHNLLLEVKGISERLARVLYTNFPSLQAIKEQSFTTLNQVIKNKTTTKNLQKFLSLQKNQ